MRFDHYCAALVVGGWSLFIVSGGCQSSADDSPDLSAEVAAIALSVESLSVVVAELSEAVAEAHPKIAAAVAEEAEEAEEGAEAAPAEEAPKE